jgi:prolipoprotein diacylglyceryl transferase
MINLINPILINFGPFTIRWYGLFLATGLLLCTIVITKLAKKINIGSTFILEIITWLFVGGIVGARISYILFYRLHFYLENPIEMILINHGGLSSHGFILGIIVAYTLFIKIKKIEYKKLLDIIAITIPLFSVFVRLGNYFNSEIIGRLSDVPWSIKFALVDNSFLSRHPVQLYEALFGLILFLIMLFVYIKKRSLWTPLTFTKITLLAYFVGRFILEFFKEFQIFSSGLTMGQYLSLPIILFGIVWCFEKTKT